MLTLRTLVVATDGSAPSEAARVLADRLAARHGAHLHVLQVEIVRPEMQAWPRRPEPPPPAHTEGGRTEVRRRSPLADVAIVDYAAEVDADLLVMGTHGRRGVERVVLGSTAEGVLRRAPCPVLTVRADADADARGPVLAPIAFEPASEVALDAAAAFAEALDTHVVALHVVEPVALAIPHAMTWEPFDMATLVPSVEETLARWVAPLRERGVAVETRVAQGPAATEIVEAARQASLVVQASHGRRGLGRWLLGSVAEEVARQAPCPVLTLRADTRPIARVGDDRLRPVARRAWASVCDALAARAAEAPHRVTLTAGNDEGSVTVFDGAPLVGITYDARADALQVMTAHGSHALDRPAALRATAGAWTADTARDPAAEGPWTLEAVRNDGHRERIEIAPA